MSYQQLPETIEYDILPIDRFIKRVKFLNTIIAFSPESSARIAARDRDALFKSLKASVVTKAFLNLVSFTAQDRATSLCRLVRLTRVLCRTENM